MIGKILGNRYEILEIVGSGGMAIVYKAKCRLLNRFVAVKMLREELKSDKEFVERFRVEAQSAASLSHHNIVSVFDVGEENGRDYFVMEYIEGVTLKELIKERNIDWKEACDYAIGICDAIEHAHRKNIVHRDIKPHNIMITRDGEVKVTDFGIARAVSSSTLVRQGNMIGSVHYFSPEQAVGGIVDFKSDIYSIGVVLYEMLSGRLPFDADNPVAVAKMHVDNPVVPVTTFKPQLPPSLSDIVLKAMSKQPSMRYQSAAELAQDLKRVKVIPTEVDVKDKDATTLIPIVKPADKNWDKPEKEKGNAIPWIISAAVLVICAIVLVFAINSGTAGKSEIPDLIGMNIDAAIKQYENADFEIKEISREYSEEEEDIIISQNPEKGKYSDVTEIEVTVSRGSKYVKMKNFEGDDIEKVQQELSEYKNVQYEYESHSTYPKNTVFKQSPGPGSTVSETDRIVIYVSTGKEDIKVKVPSLKNLTKENAISTLKAVGLEEGEIRSEYSDVLEGYVISQVISVDTLVPEGTKISFTISKGPEKTSAPTPTTTPTTTPSPDTQDGETKPAVTPSAEPDEEIGGGI